MIRISVKADIRKAIQKLQATRQAAAVALPRALNKVATTVRAEAAREIRAAGYGLKVSTIKEGISIRRATRASPTAVVVASGQRIPLLDYGARQTKQGVSVKVLNGRKVIKHAFIAQMANGHRGVFVRKGTGFKRVARHGRTYSSGLPIEELFGPSIPAAFVNQQVQRALDRLIRERFPIVFEQELRYAGLKR